MGAKKHIQATTIFPPQYGPIGRRPHKLIQSSVIHRSFKSVIRQLVATRKGALPCSYWLSQKLPHSSSSFQFGRSRRMSSLEAGSDLADSDEWEMIGWGS